MAEDLAFDCLLLPLPTLFFFKWPASGERLVLDMFPSDPGSSMEVVVQLLSCDMGCPVHCRAGRPLLRAKFS
jgi:hypothetical protein